MTNLTNTHSVSDFQLNPIGILGQLKSTHIPVILTVDGKPELVVQDAESYQQLLDKVEAAEDLEAVRQGLEQSLRGQVRPAAEFFRDFEAKHGL